MTFPLLKEKEKGDMIITYKILNQFDNVDIDKFLKYKWNH